MGDVREENKPSMAGGVGWSRPAARRKNERGKLGNMVERGEHQLQEVAYSRFEPLDGENGGRTREFHGEVKLGQT